MRNIQRRPQSGRNARIAACAALAMTPLVSRPAGAAVTDSGVSGFTIEETVHIAADDGRVYAALIAPAHWWSSAHTFSGNASNLTLDAKAGGCWCETLPDGGSVLHLTVVNVAPGRMLRLRGALGPFQAMAADGALTWTLKPAGDGTDLVMTYAVFGYAKSGFDGISHAADGVLAEQAERLKHYAETGSPEPSKEAKP
jgi:uncharacterized protein YndB with AHSA1/START domain